VKNSTTIHPSTTTSRCKEENNRIRQRPRSRCEEDVSASGQVATAATPTLEVDRPKRGESWSVGRHNTSTKWLQQGVANNKASKDGMTSADANNVKKGSRTFIPKRPPRTCAMNQYFDDAFKKVDDVVVPSPPAQSNRVGFSPKSLFDHSRWGSLGSGHWPTKALGTKRRWPFTIWYFSHNNLVNMLFLYDIFPTSTKYVRNTDYASANMVG
jgi:hypothetical protein